MRFEPRRVFSAASSLAISPLAITGQRDGLIPREKLPPSIAFLNALGIANETLQKAVHRARRDGVCAARALIADGDVSECLFYRGLAHHLNIPFVADWPHLSQPFDPAQIVERGLAKLAERPGDPSGDRWLLAPTDELLDLLLKVRDRATVDPTRLCVTTPAHLAAIVRHRAEAEIVYAASHHLPDRAPHLSAKDAFDIWAKGAVMALAALGLGAAFLGSAAMLAGIGMIFLISIIFRLLVCARGCEVDAAPTIPLKDEDAPFYSVLVPLYREACMVPDLVAALSRLDYPRSKLEILLLLETNDAETRDALAWMDLPPRFRVIVVPDGAPRTKPRALNVGLTLARGTLVSVFDAEDRPEQDQLRRAAARFIDEPEDLACLQAHLAIDNGGKSLLARLFAIEYVALFDLFNVGLGRMRLPMALGGTSNHFRSAALKQVGGWDAWNVTEDADLGLRLARFGYSSDVLDSTTWEAALTTPAPWFKQRRRWTKGWMQTALVLARNPRSVWRDLGLAKSAAIGAIVINLVVAPLLTPIFLALVVYHLLVEGLPTPHGFVSLVEITTDASVFAIGIFSTLWCGYAGCRRAGRPGLIASLPWLLPYQIMISAAAWVGLIDLFFDPYHWHKTEHSPSPNTESQPAWPSRSPR